MAVALALLSVVLAVLLRLALLMQLGVGRKKRLCMTRRCGALIGSHRIEA